MAKEHGASLARGRSRRGAVCVFFFGRIHTALGAVGGICAVSGCADAYFDLRSLGRLQDIML